MIPHTVAQSMISLDRELLMNDMATRRSSEIKESIESLSTVTGESDGVVVEEELELDTDDQITIVVDGQEETVDRAKVMENGIRALQKESLADKRLRDATDRQKEVTDLEAKFEARQNQFRSGVDTDEQISEQAKNFSEAILEDEDTAGEMFKKVLTDNRDLKAATADLIDEGKQTRTERDSERRKLSASMQDTFESDFKDIHKDTHLTNIFNAEAAKYGRDNPDKDFREVFNEAGKVVRESYMGADNKPPTTKEIKKSISRAPKRAGTGKRQLGKKAPKRVTTADVVANMRANRGQPG